MNAPKHVVAIVLPPREGFAAGATGAVGLLVQRLASWPGAFAPVVVGMDLQRETFPGIAFRAARLGWFPGPLAFRYAASVLREIRRLCPAIVEVHNRPELALALARHCPDIPVCLFLHNDPQDMRRARSPAERRHLLASLARVAAVSGYVRGRLLDGAPGHCEVLPNCLNLRSIPPSPPQREKLILFAGRVVADKGADSFVRACALALPRLPGWRAEMIGA
ncbi:MAG TPA: glycosyltransferase, partial [Acetobacteraceae bacterium]